MSTKVLLLEEDATFAAEVQRGLRALGCDVTLLREGGLGLARAVSERFDAIVLSAELPGMNGFRLCNRIRKDESTRGVPLLLMGGASADGFAEHQKLATHADAYLRKPIVLGELLARLCNLVPAIQRRGAPLAHDEEEITVVQAVANPRREGSGEVPAASAETARALAAELAAAQEQLGALEQLRERLAAQEKTTSALTSELAKARAAVTNAEALRERLAKKEREALALKGEVDAAARTTAELRKKIAATESSGRTTEQAQGERDRQVAQLEKNLAAARAEKERATKRADELARRAEKSRPEIEQLRKALEEERARHAGGDAGQRAVAEAVEGARRESAEALAQRDRAHAEALASLRAELSEEVVRATASSEEALSFLERRVDDERARARKAADAHAAETLALTRARETAERALAAAQLSNAQLEHALSEARIELAGAAQPKPVVERAPSAAPDDASARQALADAEAAHAQALAEADERHRLVVAWAQEAVEARELAHHEETQRLVAAHETALAELRREAEEARAGSSNEPVTTRPADVSPEELLRARAELEARIEELASAHASLGAAVAARTEEKQALAAQLEDTQAEIPALEAEILVLRTELANVRRELQQEVLATQAATQQLDRDHHLLGKARAALSELVARIESEESAWRGSKEPEGSTH